MSASTNFAASQQQPQNLNQLQQQDSLINTFDSQLILNSSEML
jgi:hypothetical protein